MHFVYLLLALLYVLSPYDMLPDVIAGLGWLDDIMVLLFVFYRLYKFKKNKEQVKKCHVNFIKNPFRVLDVDPSSDSVTIKAAYRKLANKYHPDKAFHMGEKEYKITELRFIEIKEAYEQLKNMGRV